MSSRQVMLPSSGETPDEELLELRARRYARVAEEERRIAYTVVSFRRGESSYAIPLADLREIRPLARFCALPGASAVAPGVVYYRGELLSLHDLSAFVSGKRSPREAAWVLVAEHAGERIGLMADEVADVLELEEGELRSVPVTMGEAGEAFACVTDAALLVIDTQRMFHTERFINAF